MTNTESKPREWTLFDGHTAGAREFIKGSDIAYAENLKVIEKSAYDKAAGALKKYGQHTKECICHMGHAAYENACDCGFDEALKDLERS